jgi:transposase
MKATSTTRLELDMKDMDAFLARARESLSTKDYTLLEQLVQSHAYVGDLIASKGTTIRDLRHLFGVSTEKKSKVLQKAGRGQSDSDEPGQDAASPDADGETKAEPTKRRDGHGRNGADAYPGADKECVHHTELKPRQRCPDCGKGKLYALPTPAVIVRIVGQAPLQAKVYELDRLRCNLCGEIFTAEPPNDVGSEKYDATAASMIALLRYGSGLPFKRLEGLQEGFAVPLPTSTQWDIVHATATQLEPVYVELMRQAAQGEILHNDDTSMTVLEITPQRRSELFAEDGARQHAPDRTGVFTTGIVSTRDGRKVALFFTGCKHAGENITDLLAQRAEELPPPIQMCDGLSHNLPKELEVIAANCLVHGRRKFVEVVENFPDECRHVLEELAKVYKNDAEARKKSMSPQDRLLYHQSHSAPVMEELKNWLAAQFKERHVEPNSSLGRAISYMTNHWDRLTLFLREPGAPLDNNLCERALKKAIVHRKNSLFYKTMNGARVGDLFMGLIHTCRLNNVDPFDYLTDLQRHAEDLAKDPERWMPWNYGATRQPGAAAEPATSGADSD